MEKDSNLRCKTRQVIPAFAEGHSCDPPPPEGCGAQQHSVVCTQQRFCFCIFFWGSSAA